MARSELTAAQLRLQIFRSRPRRLAVLAWPGLAWAGLGEAPPQYWRDGVPGPAVCSGPD